MIYKGVEIDSKPTEAMAEEAQRGLDWREEYGRGGTEVGVARARDIKNRIDLSADTLRRMVSYFARHEVDKQAEGFSPGEDGYPSAGRIAWALWGGDAGKSWAETRVNRMDKIDERKYEGQRPYENEHAARLKDPAEYEDFRRENDAAGPGIDFIYGLVDVDGEPMSELQSIRFQADVYSEQEAQIWLEENNYEVILFEPAIGERMDRKDLIFRATDMEAQPEDDRRVRMSISSEMPVDRFVGKEILDHSASAIDMEFLRSGRAPLLLDHDPSQQIGVVESVELDEQSRRLRAVVRFGKNARAAEIYDDVKDGIRANVSIGYFVRKYQTEGKGVTRAMEWSPVEVSIVSLPADTSVGVNRTLERTQKMEQVIEVKPDEILAKRNKEVAQILELATRHNQRPLADEAISKGLSIESFRGMLLDKIGDKPLVDPDIGMNKKEVRQFSFVRAINALANPGDRSAYEAAAFEREVSEAAVAQYGKQSRGITVPTDILRAPFSKRDLNVGSATAGGNTVDTVLLADSFIELLRNRSAVQALGATVLNGLSGNISVPKQTAAATAYWVAESGAPQESQQTIGQVLMTPKTVGAFTDFSRRLMLQSSIDVEAFVRNDLVNVLALEIDRAAFYGSGNNNQPLGLNLIPDVETETISPTPTFTQIIAMESDVASANADIGDMAYVFNAAMRGLLKGAVKFASTDSVTIFESGGTVNGYRTVVSNQIQSGDIFFGVWSQLILGFWSGLDLTVDPYAGATSGTMRVIALQDTDLMIRHPKSFCRKA